MTAECYDEVAECDAIVATLTGQPSGVGTGARGGRCPSPLVTSANTRLRTALTPAPPPPRCSLPKRPATACAAPRPHFVACDVDRDLAALESAIRRTAGTWVPEQAAPRARADAADAPRQRQRRGRKCDATVEECVRAGRLGAALETCRGSSAERSALQRRAAAAVRARAAQASDDIIQRNAALQWGRTKGAVLERRSMLREEGDGRLATARERSLALLRIRRKRAAAMVRRADDIRADRARLEWAVGCFEAILVAPHVVQRLSHWGSVLLKQREHRVEAARAARIRAKVGRYVRRCRLRWGTRKLQRSRPALLLVLWLCRVLEARRNATRAVRVFFCALRDSEMVTTALRLFYARMQKCQIAVRTFVTAKFLRYNSYQLQWEAAERLVRWDLLKREKLQRAPQSKKKKNKVVWSVKQIVAADPFSFSTPIPWRIRTDALRGMWGVLWRRHCDALATWRVAEGRRRERRRSDLRRIGLIRMSSRLVMPVSPKGLRRATLPSAMLRRRQSQLCGSPPTSPKAAAAGSPIVSPATPRRLSAVSPIPDGTHSEPGSPRESQFRRGSSAVLERCQGITRLTSGLGQHTAEADDLTRPYWSMYIPTEELQSMILVAVDEHRKEVFELKQRAAERAVSSGDPLSYQAHRDAALQQYREDDEANRAGYFGMLRTLRLDGVDGLEAACAADDAAMLRAAELVADGVPCDGTPFLHVKGVPPSRVPQPGDKAHRRISMLLQMQSTIGKRRAGGGKAGSPKAKDGRAVKEGKQRVVKVSTPTARSAPTKPALRKAALRRR